MVTPHETINTKLDSLATMLTELKLPSQDVSSSTTLSVCNEDVLGRIVRAELQNVLPTIVGKVSKSQIQNERMLRAMRRTIDSISQEISRTAATQNSFVSQEGNPDRVLARSASPALRLSGNRHVDVARQSTFSPDFVDGSIQNQWDSGSKRLIPLWKQKPAILWKQTWYFNWRMGRLLIKLSTFRERGTSNAYFQIDIQFFPSSRWMVLPGISASYTDAPNQQGYYQICPLISIVPIISEDAPVWKCIKDGDVKGLQDLFAQGRANPRDQSEGGRNLLLVFWP